MMSDTSKTEYDEGFYQDLAIELGAQFVTLPEGGFKFKVKGMADYYLQVYPTQKAAVHAVLAMMTNPAVMMARGEEYFHFVIGTVKRMSRSRAPERECELSGVRKLMANVGKKASS